jgi:acetyl-CoA carboxylase biotin carboxyl carrier protein
MGMDYEKIKRMVALTESNHLTELTVEEDGLSITIKAEPAAIPVASAQPPVQVEVGLPEVLAAASPVESSAAAELELAFEHLVEIRSPMIGVFYRCSSPDSPPYVDVGEEIEVGQTIGLIEAMKVFSEVPSEIAGRVASVHAENGKLVQQGDVLLVVDTSSVPL